MDLTLTVVERKTGGFSAGGGISGAGHADGALPGFIGSMAYSQRNLFGLNQKLTASAEIGQVDSLYRLVHTDPWVGGDAYRTSRTVSIQNTRTSGNAIHSKAHDDGAAGGAATEEAAGEGNVVVARMIGGVEYGRPLATGWSGNLGVNWQRACCLNEHGVALTQDVYGAPLTFSGQKSDTMMLAVMRAVYGYALLDVCTGLMYARACCIHRPYPYTPHSPTHTYPTHTVIWVTVPSSLWSKQSHSARNGSISTDSVFAQKKPSHWDHVNWCLQAKVVS